MYSLLDNDGDTVNLKYVGMHWKMPLRTLWVN